MSTRPRRPVRYLLVPLVAGVAVATSAVTTGGVPISVDPGFPSAPPASEDGKLPGAPVTYAASVGDVTSRNSRGATGAADPVLLGLDPTASVVKNADVTERTDGLVVGVEIASYRETLEQLWYANLAYGALVETARAGGEHSLFEAVSSASITEPGPNGVQVVTVLGISAVALGQRFTSPPDAELVATVESVAAEFDLAVVRATILHPLESAVHVRLQVADDATVTWTIDDLRDALIGDEPNVEGLLIELISEEGRPLLTAGTAYRTGMGGLSFADGQDERFGAIHGSADFR